MLLKAIKKKNYKQIFNKKYPLVFKCLLYLIFLDYIIHSKCDKNKMIDYHTHTIQ